MRPLVAAFERRVLATERLHADVLVARFCDHLPLNRRSGILCPGRRGARTLDPCRLGRPGVRADAAAGGGIRAPRPGDRTPACRRHAGPGAGAGHRQDSTGRLWAYIRDERSHAGFGGLYEGGQVVEAAGWAHLRRKFHDIHAAAGTSPLAREALERITGKPPDQRPQIRQAEALPLLDDLKVWLDARAPGCLAAATSRPPSATPWRDGRRWSATPGTAPSPSTTTRSRGPCAGGARPEELAVRRIRRRR